MISLNQRRSLIAVVGLAASTAVVTAATAATSGRGDAERAATTSPELTRHLDSLGGDSDPLPQDSKARRTALSIKEGYDLPLRLSAARTVDAPSGEKGQWAIVPIDDDGACVFTGTGVGFCGQGAEEVESGNTAATEYPEGTPAGKDQNGEVVFEPSTKPGKRYGIAPPGATNVVVITESGRTFSSSNVEHGLYTISVPDEATPARVEFTRAGTRVAAVSTR